MTKLKHFIILLFLFFTSFTVLTACNTNELPKTCQHQWIEANCLYPKTCRICQETEGTLSGHNFTNPTCGEFKTCLDCGWREGVKLQHSWNSATCQTPKTCSLCGATEGDPSLIHNYQNGKCTYCNQNDPYCNQNDPKEEEYKFASVAYDYLIESHELCVEIMDSIYSAWYFTIHKSENYYTLSSYLNSFCSEANLNQEETRLAIDKVLTSAGFNHINDDRRYVAMQVPSSAVAIVIQVYIDNENYSKIDSNLSKARTSLNSVTYHDSHFRLRQYYEYISSCAAFCKSPPTDSFKQFKYKIDSYEAQLKNIKNMVSAFFN